MSISFASPSRHSMLPRGAPVMSGSGMSFATPEPQSELKSAHEIITRQALDPLVVLYFGRRGDGKTLCMTATLNMMLQAYIQRGARFSERNPNGFKVACNYHVQFADFCDPHLVDMLSEADERMRRMIVAVDEILSYVPSRRTMARINVNFTTNCLVQIRKFDMEMLATTQRPQNIDSQMLDQIDLFIMPILYNKRWVPEKQLWTHKPTGKMFYRPTSAKLLIWDWWGTFTGKQYAKRWPPMISGEAPDWVLDYHGIHELFSWFSSKEPIPAAWHHKREDALARTWADAMQDTAQAFAPEAVEQEQDELAHQPIANVSELIAAQPDDFYIARLIDHAKQLDKGLSAAKLRELVEASGYTIIKEGGKGYRAIKERES